MPRATRSTLVVVVVCCKIQKCFHVSVEMIIRNITYSYQLLIPYVTGMTSSRVISRVLKGCNFLRRVSHPLDLGFELKLGFAMEIT